MQLGLAPKTHIPRAICFIILAAIFNALIASVAKFSFSSFTAFQMVFARNFVSLILFSLWLGFSKKEINLLSFLRPSSWKMQIIRAVFGFSSVVLFFYSLKTLDLSDATVLVNTMPVFLPFVAFLWKGIKIHHKTWWGILTAFAGILFIVQPDVSVFNKGFIFALLAGITYAISTLALRFAHFTEPSSRTLFYYFLICSIFSAVGVGIEENEIASALSARGLILLSTIGVLGLIFQLFFTLSTKYAPARFISPFYFSTVVFSVLIDRIIWNVSIDFWKIIGFVLVFIGVCLIVLLYPREITASKPGAQ